MEANMGNLQVEDLAFESNLKCCLSVHYSGVGSDQRITWLFLNYNPIIGISSSFVPYSYTLQNKPYEP